MIYGIDKKSYNYVFNIGGKLLNQAYDINKNQLLDSEPQQLKVMSYNVGAWTAFGKNATQQNQETWYTLQNSILSNEQADLIGIQEYEDAIGSYSVPTMIKQYAPYLFDVDRYVSGDIGKAGRAIASKYLIHNAREINFNNQEGEERSYLIGDVIVGGRRIKFITAHLATNETAVLQVQEILSAIEHFDYWIVTGDFNIVFNDVESEGYAQLIEPFLNKGYHVASGDVDSFGFIPTFAGGAKPENVTDENWRCADNIMCSSNIDITNVYVNRQKLTEHVGYGIDHLPLIAEVVIN